jgi:hypothetical protein
MATGDLREVVAERREEILVGAEDVALRRELDDRLRAAERRKLALVLHGLAASPP